MINCPQCKKFRKNKTDPCKFCGHVFSTVEIVTEKPIAVSEEKPTEKKVTFETAKKNNPDEKSEPEKLIDVAKEELGISDNEEEETSEPKNESNVLFIILIILIILVGIFAFFKEKIFSFLFTDEVK